MSLSIILNGQPREFAQLESGTSLNEIVGLLELKSDRIAVEHNGTIAQRALWDQARVTNGDRLEIVHFVGGGLQGTRPASKVPSSNGCAHYT